MEGKLFDIWVINTKVKSPVLYVQEGLIFFTTASSILTYARLIQSAYGGLWHGGWLTLFFHWPFAYVCENHVRFYGGGYAVEMYVSY
jgi:hypothetical protein